MSVLAAARPSGGSLWDRLPAAARVVEVAPRDGLQNEAKALSMSTQDKLELISRLRSAGFESFEATAFVSPKAVPQMADAAQVMAGLQHSENGAAAQRYLALIPNLRGLKAAVDAGTREVTVLAAATETFSRRNTNCSLEDAVQRAAEVVKEAKEKGLWVRTAIAVSMICPYEGDVPEQSLVPIVERMHSEGCDEISICDTIGKATPGKTRRVLEAVRAAGVPVEKLSLHVHDTYGQALANVLVGLQEGVPVVDASVGGLGGCPFAGPGASGNLSTEDLVYMLDGLGVETGVDLLKAAETGEWVCNQLGRSTGSRVGKALLAEKQRMN